MLGELSDWAEFYRSATAQFRGVSSNRATQTFSADGAEIKKFCEKNFVSLDAEELASLYDKIFSTRGLEVPLHEFERKYGKIHPKALKASPPHLTVSISLWGLKFRFPEDLIAKDIAAALQQIRPAKQALRPFHNLPQKSISERTGEFVPSIRNLEFAQRTMVLSYFN
jgi:hypothetical protein